MVKRDLQMSYDFSREWLVRKFEEIRRRILRAIEQLDDTQLNWRPDEVSHSVSTLIRHIDGNIKERILNGILNQSVERNREDEFKHADVSKSDLKEMVMSRFQLIIDTIHTMSESEFEARQLVRNRERTNLDMLFQCAVHFSEHMGQILYIAKMCLKDKYESTSL